MESETINCGLRADCIPLGITLVMSDPQTGQAKPSFSDKKSNVRDDTDADEEILHPTLELYRHTLLRGANMGAIVTLALGPPVLFVRGVRQPSEMLRRLSGLCVKGLVSGMLYRLYVNKN